MREDGNILEYSYYEGYINKNTTNKYDLTSVFENFEVFSNLIHDLSMAFEEVDFEAVVGLDSLGFILGGACAFHMKKGFISVRKGGGFPVEDRYKTMVDFTDYSGKDKSLEIRNDSICEGKKVIIIDDWIETGTQVKATIKMIESLGGEVVGISAVGVEENENTENLLKSYKCFGIRQGVDI